MYSHNNFPNRITEKAILSNISQIFDQTGSSVALVWLRTVFSMLEMFVCSALNIGNIDHCCNVNAFFTDSTHIDL
jgi:hypothetical protein